MNNKKTRGIVLGETPVFRAGTVGGACLGLPREASHVTEWPEGIYQFEYPSEATVMRCLTYWESIACPLPKIVRHRFPYADLLESENILRFVTVKPKHRSIGGTDEEFFNRQLQEPVEASIAAAKYLNNVSRGQYWSVGYSISSYGEVAFTRAGGLQNSMSEVKECATAILHNALPVPDANVPIESVLKFRIMRRSELLAFRAALDGLYDRISESDDPMRSLAQALETLERALDDLTRVYAETWTTRLFGSLRAYLSLDELNATKVAVAASGVAGADFIHLSPAIGAAAGLALNAFLTFEKRRHLSPLDKLPADSRDFAYLHYVGDLQK